MTVPPPPSDIPGGALSVAVTGHQDLGPATSWVADILLAAVQIRRPLLGLSSLARGADQLFADAVLRAGNSLRVVIPCDGYETTFTTKEVRAEYIRLLAAADEQVVLPFTEPSEEAFWAAGCRLVDDAGVVVAVWNGKPARGLGGTADVVRYALDSNRRVLHINPTTQAVAWI